VTRFGDFSPIGLLFALGKIFESYGSKPIFRLQLSAVKVMQKYDTKWVAMLLAGFFHELGHLVAEFNGYSSFEQLK
jgi:hypothetical protein